MGIGVSILLIAAGAILTFAVNATVAGLNLDVVGWVLMGAGVLGLIWSLIVLNQRRRTVVLERPDAPVVVDRSGVGDHVTDVRGDVHDADIYRPR